MERRINPSTAPMALVDPCGVGRFREGVIHVPGPTAAKAGVEGGPGTCPGEALDPFMTTGSMTSTQMNRTKFFTSLIAVAGIFAISPQANRAAPDTRRDETVRAVERAMPSVV